MVILLVNLLRVALSNTRAEQLFELFFKYLHPHLPFVDRQHAQPYAVARRNNFLFNASERTEPPVLSTGL